MNRWVLALACSFINFVVLGVARLVPILFVEAMARYNVDRARASLPFTLCYILRTILGPAIGLTGKKFGFTANTLFGCVISAIGIGLCFFAEHILVVTILWGCVYGFGFGFSTALLPAVLEKHFDTQSKTKANGLSIAGTSLGGIVFSPLFEVIIKEYGLSGSFLFMCGLLLQAIPASMLISVANSQVQHKYKPLNPKCLERGQDTTEEEHQLDNLLATKCTSTEDSTCKRVQTEVTPTASTRKVSTLKTLALFIDPTFLLIMITQSSYLFVCLLVWTILVDFVRDVGVGRSFEVYSVILISFTDLVGRLGLGWITDGGYMTSTKFSVVSFVLLSLVTFLFVWVNSLVTVGVVIALFGLVSGGLMAIFPIVVLEYIVPQYKIMGLTSRMILMAPLSALSSPLIGYFREQGGSYDGIFYVCGGILLFSAALCALIPSFSKRSKAKFEQNK